MIPVRLQLKNFMSYGASVPPLEMAGMNLAVLSGDNGNGKTALLDAMTWALFGETRAQSEDDVIRLGADDCGVFFDFMVEDQKYRVHKARGRKGGNVWELQIWQEDGSLRSLTGTSSRETKGRIERLLRMDYKTFLATGYLAQGRADEFARASVNDRKKVLADILDLSRYERLEELAKEKRKEAEDKELDAERELRTIDAQLELEDSHHFALEAAQIRLNELQAVAEQIRAGFEAVRSQIESMEAQEDKARTYEEGIAERDEANRQAERDTGELTRRIAQAEVLTNQAAQIEEKHARFALLSAEVIPLQDQYGQVLLLQREAQALETTINAEHVKIDRERYRLECEVETLQNEAKEEGRYEQVLSDVERQIADLGDLEAEFHRIDEQRKAADAAVVELLGAYSAQKAEQARLQTRLNALSASDAALCEYCGQDLPPAKRREALRDAQTEWDELAAQMKRVSADGKAAKAEAAKWQNTGEALQKKQRVSSSLETQKGQAKNELLRLRKRTETLPDVRARFAVLVEKLARRDYAHDAQERLMQVSALLEKNERVDEQLKAVQKELETLSGIERTLAQLQVAQQIMETDPPRLIELNAAITKRAGQIEKAKKLIGEIRLRTAALPTLRREQADAQTRLQSADEAARYADREIGQATERIAHCEKLKADRVKWVSERTQFARDKDLYKELTAAFGKKGVQALLIENALPEIEEQANDLLGRMTQGAMRVQLKTQREAKTKSVGQIETLDIIISDEAGTRPYEMFSGGEAYRINFALRVALSKMLAKRAGAPLQTLILDEGFGTQDGRGREAIADALHAIADQFALILVITHIEELKEQFPTRIEVVKGANGSTFTVA